MRTVSELDQKIASDFSWAWAKSVGGSVDHSGEFDLGFGYGVWRSLAEVGLMASSGTAQYLPPFPLNGNVAVWSPIRVDDIWLNVSFCREAATKWLHIDFTRVGRELGKILPKPDYETNIRLAARRLPTRGLKQVVMVFRDKPQEVIWKESDATPKP